MTRRYITLGDDSGRRVTLGQYVAAIKLAKANPTTEFKRGLTCWWPVTGAEVVQQFRRGMMDRISQGISYSERGDRAMTWATAGWLIVIALTFLGVIWTERDIARRRNRRANRRWR